MSAWDGAPEVPDPQEWPLGPGQPSSGRRERSGLGDLLRAEASWHEPDRDRILARIREGQSSVPVDDVTPAVGRPSRGRVRSGTGPGGGTGPDGSLGCRGWNRYLVVGPGRGGQRAPVNRRRLAWPVVAASVTVLTLATVAGARMLAPEVRISAAEPTPFGTSSLGPAVTIDGTPSPSSSERPTASTALPLRTDRSAVTPSTGHVGVGQPSGSLADAVSIKVMPTGNGTQLSLPRSGDRDWIIVGGRADGKLIRAKSPSRALGSVTVSGYGPSVVEGPYRVSWQGGTPEQGRSLDTTWQSITAVDGRIRITVPLRGDRFSVDLFAGTVRVTGLVAVRLAGSSSASEQALLRPCQGDVCPDVVSVTVDAMKLPAASRTGELLIDLGPAHPGGPFGLGLAAVAMR